MGADQPRRTHGAVLVASGILASRVAGFVRDRAIAHYFGVGPHADVFRTALRAPNVLQNLLGEGAISASFIPIYSRLLGEGRNEDAGRFAGAIFGLLLAAATVLAALGVLFARPLVALFAPGFLGDAAAIAAGSASVDRFALAVAAVRIIFPMTGVLVLAAWALGVLNSHRRFLVPYLAPVAWNAAIVAAVLWVAVDLGDGAATEAGRDRLLHAACVGALIGGCLQLAVQLPAVARLLRGFRLSLSTRVGGVREALAAFGPVVAGRGVVQISAYLDLVLASLLAPGAVAALGWAQTLYVLPVSLFGMSLAAAELPEMARSSASPETAVLAERVRRSLRQMSFLTIPAAVGYLAFGLLLVGALYRTGSFSLADTWLVYLVLASYTVGLVAATSSRLVQSAFYAFGDTRTPARVAVVRVAFSAATGAAAMLSLDRFALDDLPGLAGAGGGLRLGAVGLAAAAGVASWLELALLWRALGRRLPALANLGAGQAQMGAVAAAAVVPAALLWWLLPPLHVALTATWVVGLFAVAYLGGAHVAGIPEAAAWVGRLRRR